MIPVPPVQQQERQLRRLQTPGSRTREPADENCSPQGAAQAVQQRRRPKAGANPAVAGPGQNKPCATKPDWKQHALSSSDPRDDPALVPPPSWESKGAPTSGGGEQTAPLVAASADPVEELLVALLAAEGSGDPFSIINMFVDEQLQAQSGEAIKRVGRGRGSAGRAASPSLQQAGSSAAPQQTAVEAAPAKAVDNGLPKQGPSSTAAQQPTVTYTSPHHRRTSSLLPPDFDASEVLEQDALEGALPPTQAWIAAGSTASAMAPPCPDDSMAEVAAIKQQLALGTLQDVASPAGPSAGCLPMPGAVPRQISTTLLYVQQWLQASSTDLATRDPQSPSAAAYSADPDHAGSQRQPTDDSSASSLAADSVQARLPGRSVAGLQKAGSTAHPLLAQQAQVQHFESPSAPLLTARPQTGSCSSPSSSQVSSQPPSTAVGPSGSSASSGTTLRGSDSRQAEPPEQQLVHAAESEDHSAVWHDDALEGRKAWRGAEGTQGGSSEASSAGSRHSGLLEAGPVATLIPAVLGPGPADATPGKACSLSEASSEASAAAAAAAEEEEQQGGAQQEPQSEPAYSTDSDFEDQGEGSQAELRSDCAASLDGLPDAACRPLQQQLMRPHSPQLALDERPGSPHGLAGHAPGGGGSTCAPLTLDALSRPRSPTSEASSSPTHPTAGQPQAPASSIADCQPAEVGSPARLQSPSSSGLAASSDSFASNPTPAGSVISCSGASSIPPICDPDSPAVSELEAAAAAGLQQHGPPPPAASGSPPGTPLAISALDADPNPCPGSADVDAVTVVQSGEGWPTCMFEAHHALPWSAQQGWPATDGGRSAASRMQP